MLFLDFDVAENAVPEIMHLWDLGLVKSLFTFTFRGASPKAHSTKYVRQKADDLNHRLAKTKVL